MKLLIATIFLLLPLTAFAEDKIQGCSEQTSATPLITLSEANELLGGLGVQVKEVREAPVQGMWELVIQNAAGERNIAYLDFAKKHLMPGPIFDINSKSLIGAELRPPQPQPKKMDAAKIPVDDAIAMGNPHGKKRIVVFTDPDCPYCAKLHWELVRLTYMEPDLTIYLKMFPLKIHPRSFDKARVILGQKSLKLLDQAFAGQELPAPGPKDPAKPVDDSIKLGESLGVEGTPSMFLPDGRMVTGVRSAVDIKKMLELDMKK